MQVTNFGRELTGRADSKVGYAQSFVLIDDPEVVAMSGKTHNPIVQPSSNPAYIFIDQGRTNDFI